MNTNLIAEKNAIIEKIRQDWQLTPEEDRYFSLKNIEECSADLDNFIYNLTHLDKSADIQSQIAHEIYQICEKLSTFDDEPDEDYLEYPFGLFSGFTDEIAQFIVETAHYFGFYSPKIVRMNTLEFYFRCDDWSPFRVCVGQSEEESVVLEYDAKKHYFYIDTTPFYDPTFLPIFNMSINETHTELSFEALIEQEYKKYVLSAQNQADKLWLKMIFDLHTQKLLFGERQKNFCNITLETHQGMIYRFDTTNYNDEGNIITMYSEGAGATIFVSGINEKGKLQSPCQVSDLKIVDEKFFVVYAVPEWKRFEVQSIGFQNDTLVVTTGNKMTFHDDKRQEITTDCVPQTYHYQINTFLFLLDFIKEVFALKTDFVSSYHTR